MTCAKLLDALNKLTPEQLNKTMIVYINFADCVDIQHCTRHAIVEMQSVDDHPTLFIK